MKFRFFIALSAILLSLGSSSAIAQPSHPLVNRDAAPTRMSPKQLAQQAPSAQNRPNRGRRSLFDALDLTSEQQQQVQSIRSEYQPEAQSLQQELNQHRQELINLIDSDASESKIRSAHQKVMNKRQELGNLRFDSLLEIRKVLTPEQRSQWANFMRGGRRRGSGPNW